MRGPHQMRGDHAKKKPPRTLFKAGVVCALSICRPNAASTHTETSVAHGRATDVLQPHPTHLFVPPRSAACFWAAVTATGLTGTGSPEPAVRVNPETLVAPSTGAPAGVCLRGRGHVDVLSQRLVTTAIADAPPLSAAH